MRRLTRSSEIVNIEYKASSVILRLAGMQIVPVALAWIFWADNRGLLYIDRRPGFYIAIAASLLMYGFISALLIKMIVSPVLLRVSTDGSLEWRPLFALQKIKLPVGSVISCESGTVTITPVVRGMKSVRHSSTSTTLRLPKGIREVRDVSGSITG